jgi:uncharacterized protein
VAAEKKSTPPRVVLDTNIVLSALVFRGGVAARARVAWQAGAFTPLVSTATAQELMRVLAYPKFRLSKEDRDELLADYLPYTATVRIPEQPPKVPECRDPFDIMFLHFATAGKAKALVTGDRDLLALAGQTKFEILTLDVFLARLNAAE